MADSDLYPEPKAVAEFSGTANGTGEDPSKIQRIGRQTKGLVEDVRSWVDLKMQLTQLEVEARVEEKINVAAIGAAVAAVGGLALVFLLVAASLGFGVWLGHPAWGFLLTGGVLLLMSVVLRLVRPHLVKLRKEQSGQSQKVIEDG